MHANDHPRTRAGDWRDHAACKLPANATPRQQRERTATFFPERGENGGDLGKVAQAKAVCDACPVLVQCRMWAVAELSSNEPGIWGGMTRDERRAARRRMLAARRKATA